jgi:hypothetical protein
MTRDYTTRTHIYCAPDMVSHTKSELRRMVEINEPPSLVVVR